MVSGKGAEAKFCVSTDKGRKQAERWGQHVTPGPQAWAAAAVTARIMALFVLPVNSPEKKKKRIPGPAFLACTMLAA